MKIICTKDEKEMLIISLANSIHCPFDFTENVPCEVAHNLNRCMECTRKNIEWEVTDGGCGKG